MARSGLREGFHGSPFLWLLGPGSAPDGVKGRNTPGAAIPVLPFPPPQRKSPFPAVPALIPKSQCSQFPSPWFSLQLEDEALKFIGAHCPELVTLNLQTCLVSGTAQDSLMECAPSPAHGALVTSSSLVALEGH